MRAAFLLVLIVGMALAGAAVYMIQGYVSQTEALLEQERAFNGKAGKLVEAYVFTRDLKYGAELKEEDVALVYWPEKSMPKTIFREKDALFPPNAPGPRYILRSTEAFEPVLASRLTEPGELASLTAKLKPGQRAFAIKVSVASGVGGFVKPDDFIDISWTGTIEGELVSKTIESSVQVIAVDDAFNEGQQTGGSASTVTIAVTQDQVQKLTIAQQTGSLTMSLVGTEAATDSEAVEVDVYDALGIEKKAPEVIVPKAEVKTCTRSTRKGTEVIEEVVPCDQ